MSSPKPWDAYRNRIRTCIGKWLGGEDVIVRGHRLLDDLLPRLSLMQLQVLNITGRIVDDVLAQWLEKSFFMVSYPDARIWCNQIAALAGANGASPVAAATAACLGADSRTYGSSQTQWLAMTTLRQLCLDHQRGVPINQLAARFPIKHGLPAIMGFARPANKTDERLEPMRKLTAQLGFTPGPHQIFAGQLADWLKAEFGADMNIAGFMAAFLLDQGFTPEEIYQLRALAVANGAMACYGDRVGQPEFTFLPQRCGDVLYSGPEVRAINSTLQQTEEYTSERKRFSNCFRDPHRQEVCGGAYRDVLAAVPETIGGALERGSKEAPK
jgi:hypothetical protein